MAEKEKEKVTTRLTELPLDILVLIFPFLDAKTFLALSSTCKAFHQPSIRLDPKYWRHATRSTFRVPNQPLVEHDGVRWQKMYRRMLTQSRVYAWGNDSHSQLALKHRARMEGSFPAEMECPQELGVIADLQCGGWSTTVLNSRGTLYTAGILNKDYRYYGTESKGFRPLELPSASDESTIAIRQFSSGRSHILGLSDSGRIWSWAHKEVVGLAIKFVDVDIDEMRETASTTSTLHGKVKQVVAGWSCSSAYIYGTGIVVWDTVSLDDHGQTSIDMSCGASTDTMLVLKHSEVPRTGYQRTKDAAREGDKEMALGEEVGAVLNYILLEHFVVFVTDIGKVFCSRLGDANRIDEILELRTLRSQGGNALELQGSFRRFAVFKQYEEVITVEQSYLDACWNARTEPEHTDIEGLQWIPALQNSGVISVAFGDWHFHALHSSGKITSYGTELECCGALGLGNPEAGAPATFRGIYTGNAWAERHKGRLVPHAYTYGREVWFRPEQIAWMEYLEQGGKDGPLEEGQTSDKEAHERLNLFYNNLNVQAEVSEWIEQEGREWDKDKGEDGLGAFFALKVSAAGWHSGAIVLVNDDLASKKDVYDWLSKGFPRLKLSDGTEMPGTVDFDEWREGRPDFLRDLKISHETV